MLKNLTIYQVKNAANLTKDDLHAALSKIPFTGCGSFDTHASGWTSPRDNDSLVHEVNRQFLLMFVTEKKVLPSDTIKKAVADRAAALEAEQGFAPGRIAMKDLKDRVIDELLPRAFTTRKFTRVWINATDGHLCIETSTPSKAEEIIKCLLKTGANIELEAFRTKMNVQTAMTIWLENDEAPEGFTIDQDAELCSPDESKSTIKYVRHTLAHNDVAQHISAGKQCTKLALTWRDSISFVLAKNMTLNKIKLLNVTDEQKDKGLNDEERFDCDFTLFTLSTANLLDWLTNALGGLQQQDAPLLASSNDTDPDYDAAVAIVRETGRASISTVQRHMMIGYNRAARLVEAMEKNGVVSAPDQSGVRQVLPKKVMQEAA